LFSQRILVAFDNGEGEGAVYAQASGWDRIYLLWTFRNFRCLPQNVLNPRQQQLMASLYRHASSQSMRELSDAAVVGKIEDFDPGTLVHFSTSRKDRTPVASPPREKSADVPVLDRDQLSHAPFALGRMTLKIGAGALVAIIAVLAWHQLGAQPVSGPAAIDSQAKPAITAATAEISPVAKDFPSTGVETAQPAIAPPDPVTVATMKARSPDPAPATSTLEISSKATTKTPAVSVKTQPSETIATAAPKNLGATNAAAANDRASSSHHLGAASVAHEASADQPRLQISGRPRKLVYPEYPQTTARGKVSLQAVVEYDGAVSRVKVLTGDRTLAKAAIAAVRQWRYEPFSGAVPPLERETNITVSFISNEVVAVSFPESAPLSR